MRIRLTARRIRLSARREDNTGLNIALGSIAQDMKEALTGADESILTEEQKKQFKDYIRKVGTLAMRLMKEANAFDSDNIGKTMSEIETTQASLQKWLDWIAKHALKHEFIQTGAGTGLLKVRNFFQSLDSQLGAYSNIYAEEYALSKMSPEELAAHEAEKTEKANKAKEEEYKKFFRVDDLNEIYSLLKDFFNDFREILAAKLKSDNEEDWANPTDKNGNPRKLIRAPGYIFDLYADLFPGYGNLDKDRTWKPENIREFIKVSKLTPNLENLGEIIQWIKKYA